MADISKCNGEGCLKKYTCYRYLAPSNMDWQTYLIPNPIDCNFYWEYNEPIIYLDLDGVLTDFDSAFMDINDTPEITSPLDYENKLGRTTFLNLIQKHGISFWSKMKWTNSGLKLLSELVSLQIPIIILTAKLPEIMDCEIGKCIWIEEQIYSTLKYNDIQYIITERRLKSSFAAPNHILIDDYKKNIIEWESATGIGILHENCENTMKTLKNILKR